jgi:hypothetical protein
VCSACALGRFSSSASGSCSNCSIGNTAPNFCTLLHFFYRTRCSSSADLACFTQRGVSVSHACVLLPPPPLLLLRLLVQQQPTLLCSCYFLLLLLLRYIRCVNRHAELPELPCRTVQQPHRLVVVYAVCRGTVQCRWLCCMCQLCSGQVQRGRCWRMFELRHRYVCAVTWPSPVPNMPCGAVQQHRRIVVVHIVYRWQVYDRRLGLVRELYYRTVQ